MARELANGAIVTDDGQWCWRVSKWKPLASKPSSKTPGMISGERRSVAKLVAARVGGSLSAQAAHFEVIKEACDEVVSLLAQLGSLAAVERHLSTTEPDQGLAEAREVQLAAPADIAATLRQLADLRDRGVLTAAEFEAKKTELLSRF